MTNAEKMSSQCAYDVLCDMNRRLMKNSEGEYCIMSALPNFHRECSLGNTSTNNCDECIRLWRLEETE